LSEHTFDEVPWTLEQTFAGILFTLLPWLVFSLLLSLGAGLQPRSFSLQEDILNAVVALVVGTISEGIFLIAPAYFVKRTTNRFNPSRVRWRTMLYTLGFRRFNVLPSLTLIILGFLALIAVNILYSLLITAFHLNIHTNDQLILDRGRVLPITTYTTLVIATFIAPICEEVFFRSFIFMGLRKGMTLATSVIVSALIFAVAHGDPASFPVLAIIGVILALVRWHTHSIWPGIILHTLNNATSALAIVVSFQGVQF